jgi:hypothetical protein
MKYLMMFRRVDTKGVAFPRGAGPIVEPLKAGRWAVRGAGREAGIRFRVFFEFYL